MTARDGITLSGVTTGRPQLHDAAADCTDCTWCVPGNAGRSLGAVRASARRHVARTGHHGRVWAIMRTDYGIAGASDAG